MTLARETTHDMRTKEFSSALGNINISVVDRTRVTSEGHRERRVFFKEGGDNVSSKIS